VSAPAVVHHALSDRHLIRRCSPTTLTSSRLTTSTWRQLKQSLC
jgi:hypothetical protein